MTTDKKCLTQVKGNAIKAFKSRLDLFSLDKLSYVAVTFPGIEKQEDKKLPKL